MPCNTDELRHVPLFSLLDHDELAVLAQQVELREFAAKQRIVRGRAARNPNEVYELTETTGEKVADRVAGFGGSWTFIITFLAGMAVYVAINAVIRKPWDPYPFILLNLVLSMLAAIQAPVIMMSQNRQDAKDRVRSELDFQVNRRAEAEIQALSRKMHALADKMDDIDERLPPVSGSRNEELQG